MRELHDFSLAVLRSALGIIQPPCQRRCLRGRLSTSPPCHPRSVSAPSMRQPEGRLFRPPHKPAAPRAPAECDSRYLPATSFASRSGIILFVFSNQFESGSVMVVIMV